MIDRLAHYSDMNLKLTRIKKPINLIRNFLAFIEKLFHIIFSYPKIEKI